MGTTGTGQLTYVAVDTCVLFALAGHNSKAWNAVKALRNNFKPVVFLVSPTVLSELMGHLKSKNFERQRLANLVFQNIKSSPSWKDFKPCDFVSVGHGIVEQIAKRLHKEHLLPESEWNDSLIIGEAALHECAYLLTEDHHILDISSLALDSVIKSFTLDKLTAISCSKYGS